jgi:integrase
MTGVSAKKTNRLLTRKPENREFITDKTIERLVKLAREGEPTNRIIWDEGSRIGANGKRVYAVPGFGVRTTVSGQVAFIYNYNLDKHEHRLKIGDHDSCAVSDARAQAQAWAQSIENGTDPMQARRAQQGEPKFAELAGAWLVYAKSVTKKRETSLYDDRRMLGLNKDGTPIADQDSAMQRKRILPVLGERRLSKITENDIARLHNSLSETPYRANRVLVLVQAIFNYGKENSLFKDWIEENPAKGVKKFHEEKKENWLSEDQIARLQKALDEYSDQNAANCFRLLLLTGSRVGETLKAQWSEFDLERGRWKKPAAHVKQKTDEGIPLSPEALDLLRGMKPRNATGPLFPALKLRKNGKRYRSELKRPWLQVCRAAKLMEASKDKDGKPRIGKNGKPIMVPSVRVHDIRHTFGTNLMNAGFGLKVIGKLMGHKQVSTTARYSHAQDDTMRTAVNQLAEIIKFKKPA